MGAMKTGAVIYCRVSTTEQVSGTSLETQETTCRAWCARQGLEVLKVFSDRGESAKTADRPQFQAAMDFCRQAKGKVSRLVVFKVDRFSRATHDYQIFRALLTRYGVMVASATEPMTDDPAGQLLENVLSSIAQFDNQVRAERTRSAMRSLAERGWWVFRAPVGFIADRSADGCPTLRVDAETGTTIASGFAAFATGRMNSMQIADRWASRGVRRHDGGRFGPRHVVDLFRQPVYAGFYRGALVGAKEVAGQWPAIVDRETWDKVQAVMNATVKVHAGYQRAHHDFPLRGFVRCGECGRSLTGSWSRGRSGKYAYYHCPKGCRSGRVSRDDLHEAWGAALDATTEIYKPIMAGLQEIIADVVRQRVTDSAVELQTAADAIVRIEQRAESLLDHLLNKTIDAETYQRRKDMLDADLARAKAARIDAELAEGNAEAVMALASQCVGRMRDIWECQGVENRQRFQSAVFPGGLTYSRADGFGTVASASIFAGFHLGSASVSDMAPPTGSSWNRIVQLGAALRCVKDLIRCA